MPDELDALIRRAVVSKEKAATKKRAVLQPAPSWSSAVTRRRSEPSITPGACWGKLTSKKEFDPKEQLAQGCGVELTRYEVEKIDVTGSEPVISSRARPIIFPFAQRSFPYYLEKAALPEMKQLTGAAARLNSKSTRLYSLGGEVPFPDALAKFHRPEPVYPSRFAKRVAQASRGASSDTSLTLHFDVDVPRDDEYSVWGFGGAPDENAPEVGRGDRERDARLKRRTNFHSEVGLQEDPSSIVYGRPHMLKSALESEDDKPFRVEMPVEPAAEEAEGPAAAKSPVKIKEVENEPITGRDKWLPWNYEQMMARAGVTETAEQ
jgi:hypothetical protein